MNSVPRLYITCVGQGYQVSYAYSTWLATVIACLFGIAPILNHLVTGSIIVTHHSFNSFLFPFLLILYGPIRFTHSTSHGSVSASLAYAIPLNKRIIISKENEAIQALFKGLSVYRPDDVICS